MSDNRSPLIARAPAIAQTEQLQKVLLERIIPWIKLHGIANVFTAYPSWQDLKEAQPDLPDDATVVHQRLRGSRVPGRKVRHYSNLSIEDYRWPRDHLRSVRMPKLCFVLEGSVAYQISDYVLHCNPGHGILLPPGTPFPDETFSVLDHSKPHHNACEMLMILPRQDNVTCWTIRQWNDESGQFLQKGISSSVTQSQVTELLYRLLDEISRKQMHWQRLSGCILEMILSLMHRELQHLPAIKGGDYFLGELSDRSLPRQNSIKRVEEYIQNNLQYNAPLPLTIEQMARYASLSRTIFIQQFRARTGKSFIQYVNDCRYQRACELLQRSDLAIGQICLQVGIAECSLRVLIQQRAGVSPSALRRQYHDSK